MRRPVTSDALITRAERRDDVVPDAGYSDVLRFLPRAATTYLLSRQSQPAVTAAVVEAAHVAAGCRRATAGGGYWHAPRAPPPPLPLLASNEAPTKSLFFCRERDRKRFTPAEFRLRLCALPYCVTVGAWAWGHAVHRVGATVASVLVTSMRWGL